VGCEENKPAPAVASSASADAGRKGPTDNRIVQAVESAARQEASANPNAGPPPNGIFGPGEADKAFARGTPRKVDLLDAGAEPRVALRAKPDAGWPKSFQLSVAQRIGPQALPTLEYTLVAQSGEPKDAKDAKDAKGKDAKGKKGGKEKEPAAAPAAPAEPPTRVTISLKDVGLAKTQPGAVPRDLDKEVGKLKGATIVAQLDADGGISNPQLTLPKGADEGLRPVLASLVDALDLMWLPAPDKPVGQGGYWMVVDRAKPVGFEVIRYRVYKVKELKNQQATVTLDLKQYFVGGALQLPGLPEGVSLSAASFESTGQGALALAPGARVPSAFGIGLPFKMQMTSGDRPGQAMVLQAEFVTKMGSEPEPDDQVEP